MTASPGDPSPSPSPTGGQTLTLHGHAASWVIGGLLALMAVTLIVQVVLPWINGRGGKRSGSSFFEIPYITWYLLHFTIAALGLLVISILAIDDVLDTAQIGTLLGSLFGYVLGASTANRSTTAPPTTTAAAAVVTITPNRGHAGDTVLIEGTHLTGATVVTFGTTPVGHPPVISPSGTLAVTVPAAPAGTNLPAVVNVTVTDAQGHPIPGGTQGFTYTAAV